MRTSLIPPLLATAVVAAAPVLGAQQALDTEVIATGLNTPVFALTPPGETASRLFVLTHWGRIRIIENDVLLPTPFLDVSAIRRWAGEDGVHCMAFHPDYAANRRFFITYTDHAGDWVLAEYLRDPVDPNLADPNSARILLVIPHPSPIHYSGWMEFGNDGYLWIGVGDGADQGDPLNHSQRGDLLLGKLLRLDVDNPAPGLEYGIPPTNPFVNDPNVRDEIWALGLRNPWRCDYDEGTGDVWLGDVGYATWEEVDFLPAGVAGANFGWRMMEGNHCYNPSTNCNPNGTHVLPVHEWQHGGSPFRCSVTGGKVYRGADMADMHGRFFFADYCSGEIWSMRWGGSGIVDFHDHSGEFLNALGVGASITGFGADANGEIYVLNSDDGSVHRVIPAGLRIRVPQLTAGAAATIEASRGTPLATIGLLYSLAGLGPTTLPRVGVTLGIQNPALAGMTTTDANGAASFPGVVPPSLRDRTIWFQAAQRNLKSNVPFRTIE